MCNTSSNPLAPRSNLSGIDLTGAFSLDKAFKIYADAESAFWPLIGTANQLAADAVYDAYDFMEAQHLLRQRVKQTANMTIRDWERYQNRASDMLDSRVFLWRDVVRIASQYIQTDVFKLFMAIKQRLDKDAVAHSEARAHVFLAQALLDIANVFFDSLMEQTQAKTQLNISKDYRLLSLKAMSAHWAMVVDQFSHANTNIDLGEDGNIRLATKIILNRIEDKSFLEKASKNALEQNPKFLSDIKQ